MKREKIFILVPVGERLPKLGVYVPTVDDHNQIIIYKRVELPMGEGWCWTLRDQTPDGLNNNYPITHWLEDQYWGVIIPTTEWTALETFYLKSKGYDCICSGYASGEYKSDLRKEVDFLGRQYYYLDKEGWDRDVDGDYGSSITRHSFETFEELMTKL